MRGRLRLVSAVALTFVVVGCGPIDDHLVTGTFGSGRVIGLAYYAPSNTVAEFLMAAYADVPVNTPALFRLSGPQDWTCRVTFTASTGGLAHGDSRHDKVEELPSFGFTLLGPDGMWTVSLEIPTFNADFTHTWMLGTGGQSPDFLYQPDWRCAQVARTLLQQQRFVQRYLTELHNLLFGRIGATFQEIEALNNASQAKTLGDGMEDATSRESDYRSAAGYLTALGQLASGDSRLAPNSVETISGYTTSAAALLLQTGLS